MRSGHLSARALVFRQLVLVLRQPRTMFLFGVYLAVLSISMAWVYGFSANAVWAHEPSLSLDRIGREIFRSYAVFSLLGIGLLTPLIGVQAFAFERESDTLDLLLTAPLPVYGLVLAKIIAASLIVFLAVLGTLPMLGLVFLMGGVGPLEFTGLAVAELTLVYLTLVIGIWAGSRARTMVRGLFTAYGTLLLLILVTASTNSFIWKISLLFRRSGATFLYILGGPRETLTMAALLIEVFVFFAGSLLLLRFTRSHLTREVRTIRTRNWKPLRLRGKDSRLWSLLGVRKERAMIRDSDNPVFVMERKRFLLQVTRRFFDAPSLLWIFASIGFIMAFYPVVMMWIALVVALVFTPVVGANVFTGERSQGTWDLLRTTLLREWQIFKGKIAVTVAQTWIHIIAFYLPPFILAIGMTILIAFISSGSGVLSKWDGLWIKHVANMPIVAANVFLLASISVWASARYRRPVPALIASYGMILFLAVAPLFLTSSLGPPRSPAYHMAIQRVPLSLIRTIVSYCVHTWYLPILFVVDPRSSRMHLFADLPSYWTHLLLVASVGVFFCQRTLWRLRRIDLGGA